MTLPFLAQRLFNVPLAIHPRKAEIVIGALAERLGVVSLSRLSGGNIYPLAFDDSDYEFRRPGRQADLGYDLVSDVAVIPVYGTLVQKTGAVRPYSGMTGYDTIRSAFLCAMEDPSARGVVLDIDSPGGEVAGLFDLCDELSAHDKPMWAILNEQAYSAAYAIATTADRITVPRTGGVGSIGVVCCHVDFSEAMARGGIKVTFIQSGARKTDGAPEKPLSDEALSRFQADIDAMAGMFFDLVSKNRPRLTVDAVRDMEAATFMGAAGVAAKLSDAVVAPDAALRDFVGSLGHSSKERS